jgi:hypothetical protein
MFQDIVNVEFGDLDFRCRNVERGAYYSRLTTTRSSAESYDHDTARRLWEVTEALRGPFAASAS